MADITLALRRLRRRMVAQSFVAKLTASVLVAGGWLVVALGWQVMHGVPAVGESIVGAIAMAVLGAAVWTALRAVSLAQTAERIDARAGARDRFTTALAFASASARTPWQELALEECHQFIHVFNARLFLPWRVPRELPWLIVPVIASALLNWHGQAVREARRPDPRNQLALEEKARALEELAEQLQRETPPADEALAKITAALRQAAEQMRESKGDANKAALREISTLQQAIAKMQNAAPPELAALADALQQANRDAAEAIRRGELENAASQIEQAARDSAERAGQMAEAMKQAAAQLGAEKQSEIAQAIAQAAAAGSKGDAAEALQRLAEALRKSASSQQARRGAGSQARQQALNALQEMKFGRSTRGTAANRRAGEGANGGTVAVEDFAKGKPAAGQLAAGPPSGQAGSKRDVGTTKTPFGQSPKPLESTHPAVDLKGTLGEGESLQTLVTTHGDESRSTARYRQLYESLAPAAEDAVMQENIPLGSRFFVKRYFENIRPQE